MVEARDILTFIGLGLLGIGALLIGLGLADVDSNTLFIIIMALLAQDTPADIIPLILFILYSPGIAIAGITLAFIGPILILISRIIAMVSGDSENKMLAILEWVSIGIGITGAILGAITLNQWQQLRLTDLIIALASSGVSRGNRTPYILLGLLIYMAKPTALAIIATLVTLGGMLVLLIPKLIKLKEA